MRRSLLVALCLSLASSSAFANPSGASARVVSRMIRAAMAQTKPSATGAVATLIQRAQQERDPAVQKMAVSTLLRTKLPVLREQKKAILALARDEQRGLLPKMPPLPKTGTIEVRHYAMQGFLAADIASLKQAGFFVKNDGDATVATKGRMRIVLRETAQDILRDLNDPAVHMVMYTGHSQIGGTVEQALQQQGLNPIAQRKLVALFQCVGTQTMPMLKAHAPMAEVITSNAPLYVNEIPNFVRELYAGLESGENYQRINRRLAKVAWEPGRLVSPNQIATLKSVDFDHNGELDDKQAPGAIEVLPEQQSVRAESLMSGVHFLRTLNPYYVDETPGAVFKKADVKVPLVSKGIVKGDGKSVTKITEVTKDGSRQYEIELDDQFASASPRLVGAAAVYELQMHLQKKLLGKDDARAKARALAFAGEYLDLMPRQPGEAQAALDQLTQMKGLPRVNAWAMSSALAGSHILGEDQVTKVEKLLAQK